ncbi:hypothetical protein Q75_10555 [Bacillus coahuilensis p1.1.43]|uniref:NERD domain-containing protein n=1 Tax=Bacillus coahuilensis p1.1.43 TaxID=1150625 RepID=A0A147K6W2_9BACI|nr:nuclease-related domain-containing protein [Bacillus coahuilensis]KUP05823.1 hypothetical protein Q75_10555 [Bacillus coahuilensis p1.1.43]
MITKPLTTPIPLLQLQVLKRRLPSLHPSLPLIEQSLQLRTSGHKGETTSEYYFKVADSDDLSILFGLRIKSPKGYYFQMDVLVLHQNFYQIYEIKNEAGTHLLDPETKQYTKLGPTGDENRKNPFEQVSIQNYLFKEWLKLRQLPVPSNEQFVVKANRNSIFKMTAPNKEITSQFIPAESIVQKILNAQQSYKHQHYSQVGLKQLTQLVLGDHNEYKMNLFSYFPITEQDIVTGVLCPHCSQVMKAKDLNHWNCVKCGFVSDICIAKEALKEHFYIFQRPVNTRECMEFLKLNSRYQALRILKQMHTVKTGNHKDTKYFLKDLM